MPTKSTHFISWNINGIRSVQKQGFWDFLKKTKPDILCLQETRTPGPEYVLDVPKYHTYWNHGTRPGYGGVAIFSKVKALDIKLGMGHKEFDKEARVITAEYAKYYLVNAYIPNSQRTLARLPYRVDWDKAFLKYLKKLDKKKPVIYCGDFNVAHTEIDLSNPKGNAKNHGFTPEERTGFDNMIKTGFIDSFREFNTKPENYTWWSRMHNCRNRNLGWRLDYFCLSKRLTKKLKTATILHEVQGSDHCPVSITL
ncbi:MAG: exodeoxyribonuclease-3 [Candidatus Omnitrophota bacterium]|jgi:exodeoxyribonuclease-3